MAKHVVKMKWKRDTNKTHFFEVDTIPNPRNPNWSTPVDKSVIVRNAYLVMDNTEQPRPSEITVTIEW